MSAKPTDPQVAKLESQIAERRLADAKARVTDASTHLRQAIDLIVDVDTTPDIHEAADAMDRAATVFLRFLASHGSTH